MICNFSLRIGTSNYAKSSQMFSNPYFCRGGRSGVTGVSVSVQPSFLEVDSLCLRLFTFFAIFCMLSLRKFRTMMSPRWFSLPRWRMKGWMVLQRVVSDIPYGFGTLIGKSPNRNRCIMMNILIGCQWPENTAAFPLESWCSLYEEGRRKSSSCKDPEPALVWWS